MQKRCLLVLLEDSPSVLFTWTLRSPTRKPNTFEWIGCYATKFPRAFKRLSDLIQRVANGVHRQSGFHEIREPLPRVGRTYGSQVHLSEP